MTANIMAFSLFNSCSHISAFDHERHLVSWLHIMFCDVGAGYNILACISAAVKMGSN